MNFSFLNIPVRIKPVFWIFLLFFTHLYEDFSVANIIVGIVMAFSLLFHEYGHALTSAYFGARPSITLEAFGGYAEYNPAGMSRLQEFLITMNGPLFTGLLVAASYFLLEAEVFDPHGYADYVLYVTMRLNILWGLLNLIPVIPLDGGRLLQDMLEAKFGSQGTRMTLLTGMVSSVMVVPYLFYEGYTFFALFIAILGVQSFQKVRQGRSLNGETQYSTFMRGLEAANEKDHEKAKQIFKKLIKSKDSYIKHSSIESLAKIYCHTNKEHKSYKLLLKADHNFLNEGKHLLCKLAYERKNYELVGRYAHDIYAIDPSYETALLNSRAYARMNQPGPAGAWLSTASQFGIEYNEKVKEVLLQAEYDSVRNHEAFKVN